MKKYALFPLLLLMFSSIVIPQAHAVSLERTGDPKLSAWLAQNGLLVLNDISAVTIQDNTTTFAGLGADENSQYEIASLTKLFTYDLLRKAVGEKKIKFSTTFGDITGIKDANISDVPVIDFAHHTSGLPHMPTEYALEYNVRKLENKNPYVGVADMNVLARAAEDSLRTRGTRVYSNFGVTVLGNLMAIVFGEDYNTLIQKKILTPLRMNNTFISTTQNVTASSPRGLGNFGQPVEPWIYGNFAPAGGLRSTVNDLEKFIRYLLKAPNPDLGVALVDPAEYGPQTFFHTGLTGGFNAVLVFSPEQKKATLILNNVGGNGGVPARPAEDLGKRLFKTH